jgi:hypothetical protein
MELSGQVHTPGASLLYPLNTTAAGFAELVCKLWPAALSLFNC